MFLRAYIVKDNPITARQKALHILDSVETLST